jgi:hypothetical protein
MAGDAKIYRSLSGSEIHAVFGNIKFGDIQMIKYAVSRQKAPIYTMGSADMRAIARGPRSINGALVFSHLSTGGLVQAMSNAGHKIFLSHDELANYNESYREGTTLTEEQKSALRSGGTIGFQGVVSKEGLQSLSGNYTSAATTAQTQGTQTQSNFDPFAIGEAINPLKNYGDVTNAWLADQLPPFDITLIGVPETAGEEISKKSSTFSPQSLIIRGVEFVSESSGTSIEDLVIEKQMSWLARSLKDWHDVKLS